MALEKEIKVDNGFSNDVSIALSAAHIFMLENV
jgi:hypothetical protein